MSQPEPDKKDASDTDAAPKKGKATKKGEAGAPKGKSKLPLIAIVVVVLLAGGGGAWWFMSGGDPAVEAAHEEPTEPPGVVAMEPFVVNLADAAGSRFFRVSLGLLIPGVEKAKEVEESPVILMRLRSVILELLAIQTADQLITPEGKAALKKAIAESATHVLEHEHMEVSDVLFTEFVVQ